MQVFKAYFQILRKHMSSMFIYLGIFLILAALVGQSLKGYTQTEYTAVKGTVAILSSDGDSPLVTGLTEYLSENAELVSIGGSAEDIQDALFYGSADVVLQIPEGFTESLLKADGSAAITKTAAANSPNVVNIDLLVNKYLNLAALYAKGTPDMTAKEIADSVQNDLTIEAKAEFAADAAETATYNMSFYFRILTYSILAMMILGVTTIMLSFNEKELNRRNQCAPVSLRSRNLQLALGNGIFALIVWAVMCLFIFVAYGQQVVLSAGIALMCLNALVFTVASLGIGFLAGKFLRTHIAQAAFTNVVALGISFLSGVFVSQELLSSSVLRLASFTPAYWYIKATRLIAEAASLSGQELAPIRDCLLIQLGFAAAFIVLAMAAEKQRAGKV